MLEDFTPEGLRDLRECLRKARGRAQEQTRMDPHENLREQLEIATRMQAEGRYCNRDDADRLAELVLALNGWLAGGGFLPRPWQTKERV